MENSKRITFPSKFSCDAVKRDGSLARSVILTSFKLKWIRQGRKHRDITLARLRRSWNTTFETRFISFEMDMHARSLVFYDLIRWARVYVIYSSFQKREPINLTRKTVADSDQRISTSTSVSRYSRIYSTTRFNKHEIWEAFRHGRRRIIRCTMHVHF